MPALKKTFRCRNRRRTKHLSHDDHKATVLTEQSLSVRTLVRMTWVNQQNDINGHNDATCTCLELLYVQKTTDFILLSYTRFISCRSSYEWDFTTKYRVFQLWKTDSMTAIFLFITEYFSKIKKITLIFIPYIYIYSVSRQCSIMLTGCSRIYY